MARKRNPKTRRSHTSVKAASHPKVNGGSERAGWEILEWAVNAGIGKGTYYNLPEESKPRSVKVGRRTIIYEPPVDWLRRIDAAGGVKTVRHPAPRATAQTEKTEAKPAA